MRVYNGGRWTQGRFNAFIRSALRTATTRWPPKYEVLKEAFRGRLMNEATGRMAMHYECNSCSGNFPAKQVEVDHTIPIGTHITWDDTIDRMFAEQGDLQVLCKPCHKAKTESEKHGSKPRILRKPRRKHAKN